MSHKRLLLATAVLLVPGPAAAQGFFDEFSYDGLGLAGIGLAIGPIASDRVTTEVSGGLQIDLGMFAPRVRVMFGLNYFKGQLNQSEIDEFENSLLDVVTDPTGDATIDIGQISWSNLAATLDLQYLFATGSRYAAHIGAGLGAHIRNGNGPAIDGTFVEDALDTIAASADLSLGLQFAVSSRLHLTTNVRGSLSSELLSASARAGFMYRIQTGSN
jgi:hypothetical protein